MTEQNIVSQYLSSKSSISKWFNMIKDLEPVKVCIRFINSPYPYVKCNTGGLIFHDWFQQSIGIWGTNGGSAVFKSFLESTWYPSTSTVAVENKTEEVN